MSPRKPRPKFWRIQQRTGGYSSFWTTLHKYAEKDDAMREWMALERKPRRDSRLLDPDGKVVARL